MACHVALSGYHYYLNQNKFDCDDLVFTELLARRTELEDAYYELANSLMKRSGALVSFYEILTTTPALVAPSGIHMITSDHRELLNVNHEISVASKALARLLRHRDELEQVSSFSYGRPVLTDEIADRNDEECLFDDDLEHIAFLGKGRECVRSLASLVEAISSGASSSLIYPSVPYAGTARFHSLAASFLRLLSSRIKEEIANSLSAIPKNFFLSDSAMASLTNCALGLQGDHKIDSKFVERIRLQGA